MIIISSQLNVDLIIEFNGSVVYLIHKLKTKDLRLIRLKGKLIKHGGQEN